jgi:four helix bundle protein
MRTGGEGLPAAERPTFNVQHPTSKAEKSRPVFDLEERLLEYATRVIRLSDALHSTRAGNHVAGQLLRSGTSALPNHGEAQAAESRGDFVHKLKICLKELRETYRWLRLVQKVPLVERPEKVEELVTETDELIRIFVVSLRTTQSRTDSPARVREDGAEETDSMFDVGRWMLDVQPPAGHAAAEDAL